MKFQLAFDSVYFWGALGGMASITAIVGFYILLAPASIVERFNDKVTLSETRIGIILLNFSEKRFSLPWHETISLLLSNLFGERLFSAKSFARTNIHSFIACITIMYALMLWNAFTQDQTNAEAPTLVLVLSGPVFALGIVSANIITDFIAVGLCRWSMNKTEKSGFLKVFLGVIFMLLVCTVLGVVSILVKETQITWAEFMWTRYDETMVRNANVALIQHTMAFLTTFSVLLWSITFLLLKTVSEVLKLTLKFAQFPAGLGFVVDSPLRCLAMFTFTLCLILIVVSAVEFT